MCGEAREWFYPLLLMTITSLNVLENSFVENFIPRVYTYASYGDFNVVSDPPSPIWTQGNEYLILSYTPYEYILGREFENEIEEPPPNA
jgi:hypothetical protein